MLVRSETDLVEYDEQQFIRERTESINLKSSSRVSFGTAHLGPLSLTGNTEAIVPISGNIGRMSNAFYDHHIAISSKS